MNDVHHKTNADDFEDMDNRLREVSDHRRVQRSERRAAALNAVDLARRHAGSDQEPYSQSEADVIMAIMELLDRVAGGGSQAMSI